MDELLRLHAWATVAVQARVAAVRPTDLDRPTPCAGWPLRALLEHMVGQDLGFAAAARGEVPTERFAPQPLIGSAVAAHAAAALAVVTSFATTKRTEALLPEVADRRLPLTTVTGIHVLDTLIHGWDVSAALGNPVQYADELVRACLHRAELVPAGPSRTTDQAAFRPALATDPATDPWDRALRLLGRDPHWAPGQPPT
ncbi:MAG: hypothetical protein JWP40_4024 [Blastococcus sp.]|nr:hypothetical protein [Blastococcus sp.]